MGAQLQRSAAASRALLQDVQQHSIRSAAQRQAPTLVDVCGQYTRGTLTQGVPMKLVRNLSALRPSSS